MRSLSNYEAFKLKMDGPTIHINFVVTLIIRQLSKIIYELINLQFMEICVVFLLTNDFNVSIVLVHFSNFFDHLT